MSTIFRGSADRRKEESTIVRGIVSHTPAARGAKRFMKRKQTGSHVVDDKGSVLRYRGRMLRTSSKILALLIFAIATSGCCKGCTGLARNFAQEMSGPKKDADAEKLVEERVKEDQELLSKICGVSTAGLVDLVVKRESSGTFRIEGKPKEGALQGDVKQTADAVPPKGAALDPKKALVCIGVITVFWNAKEEPTGPVYSIRRVEVNEVMTKGAEYKRPAEDWD